MFLKRVARRRQNKIMLRKIITYFLILAVILPIFAGAVPLPVGEGVNISYAQEDEDGTTRTTTTKKGDTTTTVTEKTSNKGRVNDPCDLWTIAGNGTVMECLSNTIMNFFYDYVLQGAIVIAGLAGELFNASIQFSLTGKVFDADKNTMIKDGWTLVRDLLNLVFIFILLFAAISTILQYGGFEIKKVLPSLIVVALLVNFSMMIAKMVIDASHIFAWEFYNQIDVKNEEGLGDGETVANMKNSIEVYGDFEKKNLANVFIAGFNPQDFLTGSDKGDGKKSQWKEALDDSISKGGTYTGTFWQMTLILLLESVLAIFAGFVLLAGAIMFVVRVVVLWLVMIFSPLAFLSMILPSMGKYSQMWWSYLIGQSFFAPAFLFMFMLVTKFINSDFIESIFETSSNSDLKIVLGLNGGAIVLTFFHFFVVGGLMMACLIVARQLGGKTAEFGISWAHKGKELALGGAKKLAWSPARYGLRYGGGVAGDSNWFAKSIGRIPGGNMLGRKLGAMKKADEDKARKKAEKYAGTLSSAGRKSLASDMEGTKGVGGFVKRFAYTGPEGAFKPGKEGYEKIIGRKKAEKYEEENYYKNLAKLANIDDVKDSGGNIIKKKEDIIKSMINKGEEEKLDKEIEKTTERLENMFQKGVNALEKTILGIDVDLREKGSELYELVRRSNEKGLSPSEIASLKSNIDKTKAEILRKERIKTGLSGQKTITDIKRKEREAIEKSVEKYEAKQDTEKLGAKFSSSGAGGGGGSKGGGGGKTTP